MRRSGRGAEAEFGFQGLYRLRTFIGKTGLELLGAQKFAAGEPGVTLAHIQLGLDEMSFRALGVITQHLIHHFLRLIETTGRGRLIDLVHRRLAAGRRRRRARNRKGQGRNSR